ESRWTLVAPSSTSLPNIEPPAAFSRSENIISPLGAASYLNDARPALLPTNKFFSSFLINGPSRIGWTLPYVITVNDMHPFGMIVSFPNFFSGETDEEDDRLKWYGNAVHKDFIMSASELHDNQEVILTEFSDEGLSATIMFHAGKGSEGHMDAYLVRGMAYATVYYETFTPEVSSIHPILSVNERGVTEGNHTSSDGRFLVELNNGNRWILYCSDHAIEFHYDSTKPNIPNRQAMRLKWKIYFRLYANRTMTGTLRAALVPVDVESSDYLQAVELLDAHSKTYPVKDEIWAWIDDTNNSVGIYNISWITEGGYSEDLLHYALPHHQVHELLSSDAMTGIFLGSPTKGDMQLLRGSNWTLVEDLPAFDWVPPVSEITSATEMEWINYYLEKEIFQELHNVAGASVYFGAKNLMAYAQLCLIAGEIGRDDLEAFCVDQVEAGLAIYTSSSNGNPLVYDTIWGGVIGALGLENGNVAADFYSVLYTDHHFHFSYLVNAAAVVAYLRPSWATADNKNWIETLIRDVNNPNKDDPFFPQFRSFDWFCGHSWAPGLVFAYDGKDQESTSEDVNFFYAMTMWSIATGNSRLEGLGRLQTSIVSRAINSYFLLKDTNVNHPVDFVRNKARYVTGILFESKVDYTTWFGDNLEYIHGIQNIPVTAITEFVREPEFVREEWEKRLESIVESANGVWGTVLYMSYAVIQKHFAFEEMLSSGVDSGLRRSWALYWAATRPDCDLYCNHDEATIPAAPTPTPAPVVASGAYLDYPAVIPGTVEAEEFDYGGQGIAYLDTDAGNNGEVFRLDEDVDIKPTPTSGFYVGWTAGGEYLRYTVDVQTDVEAFDFDFTVAAPPLRFGSFRVVAGGNDCSDFTIDLSGLVTVQPTGGWQMFATISVSGRGSGGLSKGLAMLWLCVETSGFNIDSFTMRDASA
ncbi:unnamed protein product, partial [Ascophyllum nodosum]